MERDISRIIPIYDYKGPAGNLILFPTDTLIDLSNACGKLSSSFLQLPQVPKTKAGSSIISLSDIPLNPYKFTFTAFIISTPFHQVAVKKGSLLLFTTLPLDGVEQLQSWLVEKIKPVINLIWDI